MGFNIKMIADIFKFPTPLFPRFKKVFGSGFREDIPALKKSFEIPIVYDEDKSYEIQYVEFSSTGYKDGDKLSLIRNKDLIFSVHTKELPQRIDLRPVVVYRPKLDTLKFIYHNITGTSKVIWFDIFASYANKIVQIPSPEDPKPEFPIDHEYDWLFMITWASKDMDLHCELLNGEDLVGTVYYYTPFFGNETGKVWLDYDDRDGGTEIITILGKPSSKAKLLVKNFNATYNPEIEVKITNYLGTVTKNIVIPQGVITWQKIIPYFIVDLDTGKIEEVNNGI